MEPKLKKYTISRHKCQRESIRTDGSCPDTTSQTRLIFRPTLNAHLIDKVSEILVDSPS